jgi:hypothetical protein
MDWEADLPQNPAAAANQGKEIQVEDVDEEEEELQDDQPQLRWSGRTRRVSQMLCYPSENIFAMYSEEGSEEAVDEYMHSMLEQEDCDKVDSYLEPVFEFIVTQFAVAGLEKIKNADAETVRKIVEEICMTQYSLKAGLKKLTEEGEKAVTKELGQFHDMRVFEPIDGTQLTKEERKQALHLSYSSSKRGMLRSICKSMRRRKKAA